MTSAQQSRPHVPLGQTLPMAVAVALVLPALAVRLTGTQTSPLVAVLLYGAAFIGAALLLAWGTELAQLDLPQGLAVSILALVAILPEYAVDLLFAYQAGDDPRKAPLALANMTGANRLLIGLGWSIVVLVAALGYRNQRTEKDTAGFRFQLSRLAAVDVVLLGLISLYSLTLVFRRTLTLVDTAILLSAFGFYAYRLWQAPKEEPDFLGPPVLINRLPVGRRRAVTLALMVFAAIVILLSAEPFSGSLVEAGAQLGVDQFLMVQWVAPFATETAELIPAALFAWRQSANEGLGTLLSAKINQWSLLVGAIPLAYLASTGTLSGLPIEAAQREELLLTAAQSLFAISLLVDLRLSVREAVAILGLFVADFTLSVVLPDDARSTARYVFAVLYLVLALLRLVTARRLLPSVLRDGLVTHPADLVDQERGAGDGQPVARGV